MERVRLMCWCPNCVGGVHLPAFAAAEGGLFAAQGIEVEFVDAATAPDWSLRGLSARVNAVAEGEADFALTSVAYLLQAQADANGRLPARFAAISHQRNPIAAVVRDDSDLREPADLQSSRAARWSMPWYAQEYAGALEYMGFEPSTIVDTPRDLDEALGRGDIDVIPTWLEMSLNHRKAGFPIRAIPIDVEVYATGLLAADRLPLELVSRMRDAFVAGFDLQVDQPGPGIAAFRRRFPKISEEHIRANWALFEPNAFGEASPGAMHAERWQATIDYTSATHDLPVFPAERAYRPELLAPTMEYSPA